LNLALNGLVEIVAYIFIYFSGPLGRKPVTGGSYVLAGICCIASMLFDINAKGNTGSWIYIRFLAQLGTQIETSSLAYLHFLRSCLTVKISADINKNESQSSKCKRHVSADIV